MKVLKMAERGDSSFGSGDSSGREEAEEAREGEAAFFLENPQEEPDVKEGARSVEGEGRLWKDREVMRNGDDERRLALVAFTFDDRG